MSGTGGTFLVRLLVLIPSGEKKSKTRAEERARNRERARRPKCNASNDHEHDGRDGKRRRARSFCVLMVQKTPARESSIFLSFYPPAQYPTIAPNEADIYAKSHCTTRSTNLKTLNLHPRTASRISRGPVRADALSSHTRPQRHSELCDCSQTRRASSRSTPPTPQAAPAGALTAHAASASPSSHSSSQAPSAASSASGCGRRASSSGAAQ